MRWRRDTGGLPPPAAQTSRGAGIALWLADLAALAVVAAMLFRSFNHPRFFFDSWFYHLPFSLRLWDIDGQAQNFILMPEMAERYRGFPLLADYLQAVLWHLGGSIDWTPLINSIPLAAVIWLAKYFGANRAYVAFGMLAVPLISLHSFASLIDLFVGVCLFFQALASLFVFNSLKAGKPDRRFLACALWYAASAALAGNSKFMALPVSYAIHAYLAVCVAWRFRAVPRAHLGAVAIVLVVTAVVSSYTVIGNLLTLGNPFYPIALKVPLIGLQLPGTEPVYASYPAYMESAGIFLRPLSYILSVSELDWRIRGIDPRPLDGEITGGYGALLVLSQLAVFTACLSRRPGLLARLEMRYAVGGVGFLIGVTAYMPQAHELRYYLYVPLVVIFLNGYLVQAADFTGREKLALVVLMAVLFVHAQRLIGYQHASPFRPAGQGSTEQLLREQLQGSEALRLARLRGGLCLTNSPAQFQYAAVFHGGRYVIEQGFAKCSVYEKFDPAARRAGS